MFNGIVETVATIKDIQSMQGSVGFVIATPNFFNDLFVGASVAVNGVCLTVTRFSTHDFAVTAVAETLRVTNLTHLQIGDSVNLERAIRVDSRIGGHYVQGHVDAVGEVAHIQTEGVALLVTIQVPPAITRYLVKKGYVGLDGMSITVIDVGADWFTVTFIPQTKDTTIVHQYQPGSKINIEIDILSKYVEKLLGAHISCNPI